VAGPATLARLDVTTLYFETDAGDGFREPGFSKEWRPEPQITVGILTDAAGIPLMVNAFEGNKAEATTMVPTIKAFQRAHGLTDITVVAHAGMISSGNQKAIEDAGLSFVLGAKIPDVPGARSDRRRGLFGVGLGPERGVTTATVPEACPCSVASVPRQKFLDFI
jgi:hypothetical protein